MPISGRIAALLVAVALALPAVASAQAPTQTRSLPTQKPGSSRPPVDLGSGTGRGASSSTSSSTAAKRSLPNTGSDPRLLFLTGLALTLLGVGLRLRTADADVY